MIIDRPRLAPLLLAALALALPACGDNDDDDAGPPKVAIPIADVSPAVLSAAKAAAPDLTFYAAYKDTFAGQPSVELKGKTKSGKIKEVEVSPDGSKVLGIE